MINNKKEEGAEGTFLNENWGRGQRAEGKALKGLQGQVQSRGGG